MLQDLINEYIEAVHKASIKDMMRLERAINGLGMDSTTLRVVVKELEAEKKGVTNDQKNNYQGRN